MKQPSVPRSKKDFLKMLYESEKYKHALSRARTDQERRAIASFVTEFVGGFADVLGPIIDKAQKDPLFAQKLGQAVVEQQRVLTDNELVTSGSVG